MTESESLAELTRLLDDGRAFLTDAARRVPDRELGAVLESMAALKGELVAALEDPRTPSRERLRGAVHYLPLRWRLERDGCDAALLAALWRFEGHVMRRFQDLVAVARDPALRPIALHYLPRMRHVTARLRALRDPLPG